MRINLKNLQKLIEEFLFTIFNERGIDLMPTLNRYIDYLIRSRKSSTMWEERAVACALLLHKEEEKLKCVVKIVKSASVPWSKALDPILKFRQSSHPLSAEILNQLQMHKLKIIRLKYGWNPDKPLVNKQRFLFRMVKVNDDELIKDVKEFIEGDANLKSFAYHYCPQELARLGFADKAIAFLESSSEEECKMYCEQTIPLLVHLIEDEIDNEAAFEGLIELAKFALSKTADEQRKSSVLAVMSLEVLRREINTKLTLKDLPDPLKRAKHLQQILSSAVDRLKALGNGYIQCAWSLIEHISKVFQMDFVSVAYGLLKAVDNLQFSCSLGRILLENTKMTPSSRSSYENIALLLLSQQCDSSDGSLGEAYDSMAFPIAHIIFTQADRNGGEDLIEFIQFTRIGHDAFGLERITQFMDAKSDANDDVSSVRIFGCDFDAHFASFKALALVFENLSNEQTAQTQLKSGSRRTSMNIFEEVKNVPKTVSHNNKSELVVKCLSIALKVLVNDSKPNTKFVSLLENAMPSEEL